MPQSKRKSLSLEDKYRIIQEKESNPTMTSDKLAEKFQCGRSTVTEILTKQKAKIMDNFQSGLSNNSCKKMRPQKFEKVSGNLLNWCTAAFAANLEGLSDALILEKAKAIAIEVGESEITGLNIDWVQRFKKKHNIKSRKQVGESSTVDTGVTSQWLETTFSAARIQYADEDIFNMDETGLFWEALPERTLTFKGETCSGGKRSKNRITVLVGSNMTGSEKLPLFVIGKSASPRCFRGVKSLPVTYQANKKAWMTCQMFSDILKKLDRSFKRDVLFMLDNCPAHPKSIPGLKHIKLLYLPPNSTAVLQPMDGGIIRSFKMNYRKRLAQKRLFAFDAGMEFRFNLLDALYLTRDAWRAVTSTTISNCFKHCGFVTQGNLDIEDEPKLTMEPIWNDIVNAQLAPNVSLDDYLGIDAELVTSPNLESFVVEQSNMSTDPSNLTIETLEESDDSDIDIEVPLPTLRECSHAINVLRARIQHQSLPLTQQLDDIEQTLMVRVTTQTAITDYFS